VTTVGIVSPGAMGSAVGDALARGGARVVATLEGRSERTVRLVSRARVELVPDLRAVVREADVVLSIVPPEDAESVAAAIAEAGEGARPLLADLNAIAPTTARRLAALDVELVDGSISGGPPWRAGTTRIYLSGPRAGVVAALPLTGVERIVVGDEIGLASAVKMSTASVYKGTGGVLAQALLAARANGVLDHVLADLRASLPWLLDGAERRLAGNAAKSGRYVGEMREIAATQAAAGLTPALFEAMAEVYAAMSGTELAGLSPEDVPGGLSLDEILRDLA
jgi:3-hydroxyisobutyrate dehydrogenase-like beta-hydroxyacid dehydrogenase